MPTPTPLQRHQTRDQPDSTTQDPSLRPSKGRALTQSVLTDEILALIGHVGPVVVAPVPYTEERHRRFIHAIMEDQFMHVDETAAARSKFGGIVAPPLVPMHSMVRALGDPDPLDPLLTDPDWDGLGAASSALPPVPTPLHRVLNGGTEAEFRQLLRLGDVVHAQARYVDLQERHGASGPMLLVKTEITYKNQHDDVLAIVTMTVIRR